MGVFSKPRTGSSHVFIKKASPGHERPVIHREAGTVRAFPSCIEHNQTPLVSISIVRKGPPPSHVASLMNQFEWWTQNGSYTKPCDRISELLSFPANTDGRSGFL